ncbi:MAG: ATP-binding cassette domain-containing protein [Thermoanaerobaculia bacterium]|nr:ATP-binding cassette domain-containing protein [Thermoanaerobaculia bacterium]
MITVRGLRKVYGDGREALCGIDLEIGEGMLGVLGPNGAGKTTLLSILVLALEPTEGERVYAGLDPRDSASRAAIRRMIGYLPQDFRPLGELTAREYLAHCAALREIPLRRRALRERIDLLLEAVGLHEAASRRSGTYSGGMRRRLGIAQALIHSPRLVVVDEPTAGLDPEERIRFRTVITEVAEETAVLLSTHIVEDVEATCERIVVVAGGSVLFDDAPTALMHLALGRLWAVEAAAAPEGLLIVSRRVEDEQQWLIVAADERPVNSSPHDDVTLEEAYATFLLHRGFAPSTETT